MTDEEVERAFRQHPNFETRDGAEFESTSTPFENTTIADENSGYNVEVRAPMLDAVVEGEEVADVVETGWFETLELRLEDTHTVAQSDDATPPEIARIGNEVVVSVEFEQSNPEVAADDALAIVEYIEGTWVQGIIPGYEYGEPASELVEQATQNYDDGGSGQKSGGAGGPSGSPPM
ncbi:DUF5813 family protein [Halorussus halophilus]|uniref:DUF5813 family protein n=1 Tax=Halorussus halophilus TaxID=2650975 RepID=UPI00178864BD|nr:DUF5813 family protein [Halorussus halophilus]